MGGVSGYFPDPDGHRWEVLHNPGYPPPDDDRDATNQVAPDDAFQRPYQRGVLAQSATRPEVDDLIARARSRVEATGLRVDAESILAARDADRR